jgi:hypothetical protein
MLVTDSIDAALYSSGGGSNGGTPTTSSPYVAPAPSMDPVAYDGTITETETLIPTGTESAPVGTAPSPTSGCNRCAAQAPTQGAVSAAPVAPAPASRPAKVELRGLPWWVIPLGLVAFAGVVQRG